LLWLLAPLALLAGAIGLWLQNRRRRKAAARAGEVDQRLTDDEEARLQELMTAERNQ
jgi:cytochrome c-type biogenesis protein CcmH/NrfF